MSSAVAVALKACLECGTQFEPKSAHQIFCCDSHRYKYRESRDPNYIANNRKRCRRNNERKRGGDSKRQPWLYGAPPFEAHLPGGALTISFSNRMTFEHRQLSALHGVATQLTGPHDPMIPQFALIPSSHGCGWGIYLRHGDQAKELAGTTHSVRLGAGMTELRFGFLHRFRTPRITKRGHRKLRIDAITPVHVRSNNSITNTCNIYTAPTGGNLLSTLEQLLPKRLDFLLTDDTARLVLVERHTMPATLALAGRDHQLGNMRGWLGHCVVDTNAVGHWLLEVAARIGLGGRTAFGFGRILVSAV